MITLNPHPVPAGLLLALHEEYVVAGSASASLPAGAELVTLVLQGSLSWRDGTGQEFRTPAGCLYYQSADIGDASHLCNAMGEPPLKLLHCLLRPAIATSSRQQQMPLPPTDGRLRPIASADSSDNRLQIDAGVSVYLATLSDGDAPDHSLERGRMAWLHLITGHLFACGAEMKAGDTALIRDDSVIALYADTRSQLLLIDHPASG